MLLLLEAVAGGWLEKSLGGISAILWLAGGIKLGISVAWVFWKKADS